MLLLLAFGGTARAEADSPEEASGDVQACASAYEQAQVARNNGQLVEAQEQLRICVQDHCPDFVKADCGQWLSDVRRDIPSVIFSPVDAAGNELLDVKVLLGDREILLDGRPVELNPGQHDVVFEYQGEKRTQRVAIRQGEKNRVIKLQVVTDTDTDADGVLDSADACPTEAGPAPTGCPPQVETPAPGQSNQGLRIGAYVGWGVGGLGLIGFTAFGLSGKAADSKARDECLNVDPPCSIDREQELVEEVDDLYLLANLSLGVGIAGAATGTVLYFLSMPKGDAPAGSDEGVSLGVRPVSGGGLFSLGGAF